MGGANCLTHASLVWDDIQDAAAEKYDTTAACTFTTFNAYEYTRAPVAANLHRNVIFRNDVVPSLPISGVEEPKPQGLWPALQAQCIDVPVCDVLAIPHNSNLSGDQMFLPENADGSPLTAADAAFRARMEPIVEISQHKGDSECRPGILSNDDLCGHEKMTGVLLGVSPGGGAIYDPRLFVRNALKEGLELEESLGANPFRLGILAATDTHNATPGATNEEDYGTSGHLGTRDEPPEFIQQHPNVVAATGFRESFPFAFNPVFIALGTNLRKADFEDRRLIEACFSLSYYTIGFVTLEVARQQRGVAARPEKVLKESISGLLEGVDLDDAVRLFPFIKELDLDAVFRRGLDSILEGLAADRRRRLPLR